MLEIRFRTDELTTRELYLLSVITEKAGTPESLVLMVEFVAMRGNANPVDLWKLSASKMLDLYKSAVDSARDATEAAAEKIRDDANVSAVDANDHERIM